MRYTALILLLIFVAACQPDTPPIDLPTLAVLPSETPTPEASATPTLTPTTTLTPTSTLSPTPSDTPTPTDTPFPSETPRPTATRPTVEPTRASAATGTAAVLEAPRFSTLTPVPGAQSVRPTGTPLIAADITITEPQFQEEVNALLTAIPSIQTARVNFEPGGIRVALTALGGVAFVSGEVMVLVEPFGTDAVQITIGEITVNAPEPPPEYLDTINGDFFLMMLNALDTILKQRLGPEQNLKSLTITDDAIEVTLIVPEG